MGSPVNRGAMLLFIKLAHQNDLQAQFTGGTVIHCYLEGAISGEQAKNIVKAMFEKYTVPYMSLSPISRYCNEHGYITEGRYYGGCQYVDELEEYCCDKWREVFSTDYHVNVQPHSGSSANLAAYMSVLKPGDTILAMDLNNGGHLSHGSSVNFSGKLFNVVFYNVTKDGFIDYFDIEQKIKEHLPKLILAGASAYSRIISFERMYQIIERVKWEQSFEYNKSYNPYFMVDMAHIAGLVAAGDHPSP